MPPQKNIFDELMEPGAPPPQAPAPAPPTLATPPKAKTSTNVFDEIMRGQEAAQEARMRVAQQQANTSSPDAAAEAIRLSIETGIPAQIVERNLDLVRARVQQVPYQGIQQMTPALAEWLTKPENAKVSKDDLRNLGAIEWLLKAPSRAFAQQLNRQKYAALRVKSLFTPLTRDEEDQLASYKLHSEIGGDLGVGDSWFAQAVTGAGRLFAQSVEPAKYGVVGGLEGLAIGGAVGGVTTGGPGAIPGALATGAYTARAGLMYGVIKSAATQEAAGAYDELLAMVDETGQKLDPDVARVAAITVGGLNGAIELVGLEAFLKRFPGLDKFSKGMGREGMKIALKNPTVRAGLKRLAKQYAGGLSTEVATEVAQRAVGIIGEELSKVASGQEFQQRTIATTYDDLVLEAVHAVPEFAFGMLPGPVLGFAGDVGRAKRAEQSVALFNALGSSIEQSETFRRAPSAVETLVASATEKGPLKTVYAPLDSWTVYWQSKNENPETVAAEVTGSRHAWEQARVSGLIAIPTPRYASKLAGTEHNQFLASELKAGPDEMNGRELDEFKLKIQATRDKVRAELEAESPEGKAMRALHESVTEQLIGAGVPRGTSETAAEVLAGLGQLAARGGVDPNAVLNRYGLTIDRRLAADLVGTAGQTTVPQVAPGSIAESVSGLANVGAAGVDIAPPAAPDAAQGTIAEGSVDQPRGELVVVYDRVGRRRVLMGPDAKTYQPHPGETVGIETPGGFTVLTDNGGVQPTGDAIRSRLGQNIDTIIGQPGEMGAVPTGRPVIGEWGERNEGGARAQFVGYQEGVGSIPTMALYNVEGGPDDGTTTDLAGLQARGIPIPPTPPLLEYNQRAIASTPALRDWFGHSAVVDEHGNPRVVYHGTTQVFNAFDLARANPEANFGAGFYFTSSPEDVAENYATVGPDVQTKIAQRAEQLASEAGRDYDDPEMQAQARAEFVAQEGQTIPVFLKIERPAVVGGRDETVLTYELRFNEQEEIESETGTLLDFVRALQDEANALAFRGQSGSVDEAITKLLDEGLDGIGLSKVYEILVNDEKFGYFEHPDTGVLMAHELIRRALERTGFDGIIDLTVDQKFGSQRRIGKAMAGMDPETTHYIVFQPTQIKSALSNRGTFDPINPDILYQSAIEPAPADDVYYSRLDRTVSESKQNRAPGKQWKAMIRNSKIGTNKDEWAITKVDDLDDEKVYTKEELLAYFRMNRPLLGVVELGGENAEEADDEAIRDRAQEIFDERVQEAESDVDMDEIIGSATYYESTEEEEVEEEVETDEVDEDGDPIMETVTRTEERTVYYAAISGGYETYRRPGQTWNRLRERTEEEILYDEGSFDNERDAERAAERYLRDLDMEPYWEMIRESAEENVDFDDAMDEARREWERENGGGRVHYETYQIEPEAEEGTYREVFLTAERIPQKTEQVIPDYQMLAEEMFPDTIFEELTELQQATIEAAQKTHTTTKTTSYKWRDGHDSYNNIENPVVRLRLNVRQTLGPKVENPPLDQAIMSAGIEAETKLAALLREAQAAGDVSSEMNVDEFIRLLRYHQDERGDLVRLLAEQRKAAKTELKRNQTVDYMPGQRVVFLEEVQPPQPAQQTKMPPIFIDQWRNLALKWALRYAADLGADGLVWTTGDQQANRYNLSKKVRNITAGPITYERPNDPQLLVGTIPITHFVSIDIIDIGNLRLHLDEQGIVRDIPSKPYAGGQQWTQIQGQHISQVIGEELAERVVKDEVVGISGPALVIGGEGLHKLYDYDFKNIINKIPEVKKLGGVVGTVPMQLESDWELFKISEVSGEELRKAGRDMNADMEAGIQYYVMDPQRRIHGAFKDHDTAWDFKTSNKYVVSQQPSLLFTPELRASIQGGMAMFQSPRWRPQTAVEVPSMQAQLDAVLAIDPGAVRAHVSENGEVEIDDIITTGEALDAMLAWADEHNLQVAIGEKPPPRRGFVRNGGPVFYDKSSRGTWVRPAIEDTPKARAMFQANAPKPPRGAIRFAPNRKTTITLFETADLTTFLHEVGHFYLEVMGDLVDAVDQLAPEQRTASQKRLKTDYDVILKHLKVESRSSIRREHHEAFADAFLLYLYDGRAPSNRLRQAFARFRAWIIPFYRSLVQQNAPLTDDVRKVFDRMLATDAAIEEAEQAGRLQPMFLTPEQANMSHERFALYREAIEEASTKARERLDRQQLEEVRREQSKQWRARRQELRAEVAADANRIPVYRAVAAMAKGTEPNGTPLTTGPLKLSREMIVEQYGESRLKGLPKQIYAREGVDASAVAEKFGFGSGDELLAAVAAAPPMQRWIVQETERRLLKEHGSMLLDGSIYEKAQAAVANEARDQIIREELRALARLQQLQKPAEDLTRRLERDERDYERRWFEAETKLRIALAEGHKQVEIDALENEVRTLKAIARRGPSTMRGALPRADQLRDAAERAMSDLKISDLDPAMYWSAAKRESQKAVEAAAAQRFDDAITAKYQELINLAFYREAVRIKVDAETRVQQAQRIGKPASMAAIAKAGATFHEQVSGILDRFDFAVVSQKALDNRAALHEWVLGQEAQGLPIALPPEVLNEAKRTNWSRLTYTELVGVTDGLKQIVHLARFQGRILKAEKAVQVATVARHIGETIRSHFSPKQKLSRDRTYGDERKRSVQQAIVGHRKLASLIRELDGGVDNGPFWNAVMRPLNEAGAREAEMNTQAHNRFAQLLEAAYPRGSKRDLYAKTYIAAVDRNLSKMERLMIALNWGNEGNRDRVLRGEKWTAEQVQAVLDTLDERDAIFVQGVFDFLESYWPELAAKETRVYGVAPKKVSATSFRIGHTDVRGGYFPLKYDDRLSASATFAMDLEAANLAKQAAYGHAMTARGHAKARVETLDLPIRMDFGVIFSHVQQVIHDLSHHETLIDVGRILAHPDVWRAIYETHGDLTYKTMKNTVRDIAFGDQPASNAFEPILNHFRTGSTVVGLGLSATTPVMQLIGLSNALVRLQPRWMGYGLSRWIATPQRMVATVEWIYEKSLTMKNRPRTQQREINELRNKVGVYSGKWTGWIEDTISTASFGLASQQGIVDTYFYFIQKAQQFVDVTIWLGAYAKAMNANPEDEATAIAVADQTVLDTQGGGQIKDLAEIQRGPATLKIFTNFYSAFNVTYNQLAESGNAVRMKDGASIGRLMVDYMLLVTFPAVASYFIRDLMTADDDDDEATSLAAALAREHLAYLAGLMVGVREVSGSLQGYFGYRGPAGSRIFAELNTLGLQISQGEIDEALLRTLNNAGGILFHYPAAQVWRTVTGFMAFTEGETEDPRAILTGPPRN